ncbi:type IV pilus modification PilV family protein [Angustibacter luteus]|uniref:Type II secretion system protein n=1 Tax=Angustibacter luteus TaxID=658456 RepID=A0ABW1JAB1_9ACTN
MRTGSDTGFGLVELLFAMVIFTIIATAVAYGLQSALNTTGQNRMRVQGANLASREMEIVRHEFSSSPTGPQDLSATATAVNPHPLSGASAPMKIDGVPFTVTRTVEWLPAGPGSSPCDGGSAVTYPVLAVNVKVTWDRMGSTQPVESNTILTPPKGNVSGTISFVAVKVIDAGGIGEGNMPVTLAGGSFTATRPTADDGCAVFPVSPASYPFSYTATVTKSGYSDPNGNASATRSVAVASGGSFVIPAPISYDLAGSLSLTMALNASDVTAGYKPPTTLPPLTIYNPGITGSAQTRTIASTGATTTIPGLWPYSSGYESWPGTCNTASTSHPAGVVVPPGGSASATHRLVPVTVRVTLLGVNQVNASVVAYPLTATGCSAAENPLVLGVTNTSGQLKTSVLTGSWRFQVVGGTAPSAGWPVLTGVTRTTTAQTVNVQMGT